MTFRRTFLWPLVPIYRGALAVIAAVRSSGRFPPRRLPSAVISVGSLSAGGAGKTPMVLALAKALGRRDYAVRILTRGYGRQGKATERVDPDGDATRFGDEPMLLAQRSGVPVFVGSDRYEAGVLASKLETTKRPVYLLDDGFQHRRLARDLDVVLLTRADLDDLLLPAGNLREPLSMLRKADVVVLREEESEVLSEVVGMLMQDRQAPPHTAPPRPEVWVIRRRLEFGLREGAVVPERPLAFCGIARPDGFTSMLEEEGLSPVDTMAFADHHTYSERDVERLLEQARILRADGLVTTEKDAVKLTRAMRSRLEWVGPLLTPHLSIDLVDEKRMIEKLIGRVQQMDRRRRVSS